MRLKSKTTTESLLRVLVWDENPGHVPQAVYPEGIRETLAQLLRAQFLSTPCFNGSPESAWAINTAHLDQPEQGLPDALLAETDVLVWWAHLRHAELSDNRTAAIVEAVETRGLGLVVLHSAHYAKPFLQLLKATGHLKGGWHEIGQPEEIRVCAPQHPIAQGISDFTLPAEEMYGAPFEVPAPECLVFQSYFPQAQRFFPSGLAWSVGAGIDPNFASGPGGGLGQGEGQGRIFYFRPGHEAHPTYFHPQVQALLLNAVCWAGHRI